MTCRHNGNKIRVAGRITGTRLFRGPGPEKVALPGSSREVCSVRSGLGDLGGLARSFLESIDNAGDAVFDQSDVEVDQQPQAGPIRLGGGRFPAQPADGRRVYTRNTLDPEKPTSEMNTSKKDLP